MSLMYYIKKLSTMIACLHVVANYMTNSLKNAIAKVIHRLHHILLIWSMFEHITWNERRPWDHNRIMRSGYVSIGSTWRWRWQCWYHILTHCTLDKQLIWWEIVRCRHRVIVPALYKLIKCSIYPWQEYSMKTEYINFIETIEDTVVFHFPK